MYDLYQKYYTKLKQKGRERKISNNIKCLKNIDFSTNDYFCLSNSKILLEKAKEFGICFGVGATGSRLLSGNKEIFNIFETQIAKDKKTESALIFNSGFQANITVLSSLLDKSVIGNEPIVFFDKLNHSSLYQAVFLSNAKLVRYRHLDMNHLNDLLLKFKNYKNLKFIVTETIFGMDGDIVPIEEIFILSKKYKTFLYLDEAHATGMIGNKGYGLSTNINIQEIPHLILGTFSKALGCFGAYVACSKIIKNYLINNCKGFIYSTALPPIVIGAAYTAWNLIKSFDKKRKIINYKSRYVRNELKKSGFNIGNSTTNIIPILFNNEKHIINIKNHLYRKKLIVSAIRPPSVPEGKSRIRIAINIKHSKENIEYFIQELKKI